jgi:hypothetical protein
MVDYKNEKTISTPLSDVLKISILEKRDYVMQALKKYYIDSRVYDKRKPEAFSSGVIQLFYMVRAMLKQDLNEKDFKKLEATILNSDFKIVLEAFNQLEDYLHEKNITKIDSKKLYDTTSWEAENNAKGL